MPGKGLTLHSHLKSRFLVALPAKAGNAPRNDNSQNFAAITSNADEAANQRAIRGLRRTDEITRQNLLLRFSQTCVGIVMDCGQRFAFFHAVANALVEFQADARVDLVFLLFAAMPNSMQ